MPPGRFAVAGLSMGGYVALEVMRQAPERVSALALLNTNARPDTAEGTANRRRLMALAGKDFPAVNAALVPRLLHPDHMKDARLVKLLGPHAEALRGLLGIGIEQHCAAALL